MNGTIQTTRTGPLISQRITGVQADIGDAVAQFEGGLATIRALEAVTKGVNGLASTLRSKGSEIEQIIDVLRNESAGVPKKMLSASREPMMEQVDADQLQRVRAARQSDNPEARKCFDPVIGGEQVDHTPGGTDS